MTLVVDNFDISSDILISWCMVLRGDNFDKVSQTFC
jgi:hypothetical protein